jgi:acetyl esterase/lipase
LFPSGADRTLDWGSISFRWAFAMIARRRLLAVLILGGLSLLVAPVRADKPQSAAKPAAREIEVVKDVTYARVGDTDLQLDLALPKNTQGKLPLVVLFHGGGWRAGNRQQMTAMMEGFARNAGFVAATVSYRLVPAATFPAQIEDAKAAIRWLRAHADQYHIDPERIGVAGFSAGGHLVGLLGTTDKEAGFDAAEGNTDQSSRVQAVVSVKLRTLGSRQC